MEEGELEAGVKLLEGLALAGQVVTADALYCQRELCRRLWEGGGEYLIVVKANQTELLEDIVTVFEQPPLGEVFGCAHSHNRHGDRQEWRQIWTSSALSEYLSWPGLRQVCRIERTSHSNAHTSTQVRYAITSLAPSVGPERLLELVRGHWFIENRLHYVRDVSLGEDASQIRTGSAPQVMAALRNCVLTILRSTGSSNIAASLRHFAWNQHDLLDLFSISSTRQ